MTAKDDALMRFAYRLALEKTESCPSIMLNDDDSEAFPEGIWEFTVFGLYLGEPASVYRGHTALDAMKKYIAAHGAGRAKGEPQTKPT